MKVIIRARGHRNITAKHRTTLEITRETECSLRGDCIVAVSSDKSARDLNDKLRREAQWLKMEIRLPSGAKEEIKGFYPGHELTHNEDIVIRKSNFVCGRTLMIKSDKAARDLSRDFVRELRKEIDLEITITSLS
jgi:hypothetical protein